MTNSADHPDLRVIPFDPHLRRRQPAPAPPPLDDRVSRADLLFDDASTDRLVRIDAAMPPIAGEFEGIEHLHALSLGMSSGGLYPDVATEDAPAIAAALGFREMEIMLQTAGEYDPAFAELVAANAHAAGVAIRSVHTVEFYHQVTSPYARRAEEGREMMARAIQAAHIMNARILVWHGPNRRDIATDEGWERFLHETRLIASQCAAVGITLALENVGRCALGQVRDVTAFARRLGEFEDDAIGFVFDPFQAAESGANPFMMLAAMGNRVVNVHVSDWLKADASQRHLPPGDGDLPWPAITRAIAGSGYEGPLIIEGALDVDGETARRVRATLEPLIRAVFSFPPSARGAIAPPTELPPGVREGIRLFNQRRFYDQHEVIEHEWHAERSHTRVLYQGIIQIGVGFHHALNGNYPGAIALLTDGTEKVSQFLPTALGIDTERLVRETRACIDQLQALGARNIAAFEPELIPTIHLIG